MHDFQEILQAFLCILDKQHLPEKYLHKEERWLAQGLAEENTLSTLTL